MCHRLRLLLVKEAETPSVFSFVLPSVYLLVLTLFTTKGTTTTTITSTTSTLLPHHLTYPVNITIHLILMKYQTPYFVEPPITEIIPYPFPDLQQIEAHPCLRRYLTGPY